MNRIVDVMVKSVDWGAQRSILGHSTFVPSAIGRLLAAQTNEEAREAYWELDNRVVVQGQLFEVSRLLVPVLMVSLTGDLAHPARIRVLDLLFEIASGEPDISEEERGNPFLGNECRAIIAKGLWTLYGLFLSEDAEVRLRIIQILTVVGDSDQRLIPILEYVGKEDEVDRVRQRAAVALKDLSSKGE